MDEHAFILALGQEGVKRVAGGCFLDRERKGVQPV